MREIKFRAWDPSIKCMLTPSIIGEFGQYYFTDRDYEDGLSQKDGLMQYTSLKDKNGVEIYEGDIVRIFHGHSLWIMTPFLVVFQNAAFAIKKPELKGSTAFATYIHDCLENGVLDLDGDESQLFEIIGNIYQNPELLNP